MIIVTGTIAHDYIMDFPGKYCDHILPDKIHEINLSFNVSKFARRRGGTGGNVSYSLGLLKTPHILFATAGKDFADYKNELKKIGVRCENVAIDESEYTSTGFAMTDKINNQIWGYFLGASKKNYLLKLNKIVKKNDLVLICPAGKKASMSFVRQCIKLKIDYMFDPGFILPEVSDSDLTLGIKNAKYIIGNDYEIELIKKRVKVFEKTVKNKILITTLGEKGAIINNYGKLFNIKTAKPKRVVDPSGCGDAWRSGFLAGLSRGFDLKTCGQMGSVASSYVIEKYGCQEHKYTKKDFEKRYRQNFGHLIKL